MNKHAIRMHALYVPVFVSDGVGEQELNNWHQVKYNLYRYDIENKQ